MNFKDQSLKLMKNKYFSFLIYFITFVVILGYLAMRDTTSILCFSLVALLTSFATRNLTIILFTAIITTSFLRVHKVAVEGLEGMTTDTDTASKLEKLKKLEQIKDAKKSSVNGTTDDSVTTQPAPALTPSTDEVSASVPVPAATETFKNKNKNKGTQGFGENRVDYAATLDESYKNISDILGDNGIKGLTDETSKLMGQQKQLFESMQSMTPLMNQAKGLMEGLQSFGGGKGDMDMNNIKNMVQGLVGGKKI
jgi:hypothetical protein